MSAAYKDYYKILGVEKNSSQADIKSAYRRLARKYHPDMHPEAQKAAMTEKFKEVNEAYEVLSDEKKKAMYDQVGPDWQNAAGSGAGAGGAGYGPYGYSSGGFSQQSTGDFSDFFQSLFGGLGGGFKAAGGRGGFSFGGDDLYTEPEQEAELPLTLEDAFSGGQKRLTIPFSSTCSYCRGTGRKGRSACPACGGTGTQSTSKTVTVNLPPGIRDGAKMRLKGQGPLNARGRAGDLFLRIKLLPHPGFRLNGDDLETTVSVMPWDAALGGQARVNTIDGTITVKIPAGTKSGRKMKIAGKGYIKKYGGRGDLYASVLIDMPERLNKTQQELLAKLRDSF